MRRRNLFTLAAGASAVACGMRRCPPLAACLLLACLCCCAGGCEAMLAPLMAQVPHTDGRWTGRIVAVEVRDYSGKWVYPAAALELTGGTNFKQMAAASPPGSPGRQPLLAVSEKRHLGAIIDPAKLPVGRDVEVCGSMYLDLLEKPERLPPDQDVSLARVTEQGRPRYEYFIVLHGSPRIISK